MKPTTFAAAVAASFLAHTTSAESISDQVIRQLSEQGYSRIEIKTGPSQVKVEAIKGDRQLEVIYDSATGDVLKQEVNMVRADEDTTPGIEYQERDSDFTERNGQGYDDDQDADDAAGDAEDAADDAEDDAEDAEDAADDAEDDAEDAADDAEDAADDAEDAADDAEDAADDAEDDNDGDNDRRSRGRGGRDD
jgi:hypothetical protein